MNCSIYNDPGMIFRPAHYPFPKYFPNPRLKPYSSTATIPTRFPTCAAVVETDIPDAMVVFSWLLSFLWSLSARSLFRGYSIQSSFLEEISVDMKGNKYLIIPLAGPKEKIFIQPRDFPAPGMSPSRE